MLLARRWDKSRLHGLRNNPVVYGLVRQGTCEREPLLLRPAEHNH